MPNYTPAPGAVPPGSISETELEDGAVTNVKVTGDIDGDKIANFAGAGTEGSVPDPGAETGTYLEDDGTWSVPPGAVSSVFTRTGDVVAATSDYDADQVDFTPAGPLLSTDVQAAIEELAVDPKRILFVQKGGNDSHSGSEAFPFLTIGAAIAAAEVLTPTTSTPVAIIIGPGLYNEQVVVEYRGISFYGFGQGITRVERAGTALIIQDDGVKPEPSDLKLVGISFLSTNPAEYSVDIIGIAGTSLGGNEIQFRDSRIEGTLSIRTNILNYLDYQNTYVMGAQLYQQTAGIWFEDSESAALITNDYDNAGTKPSDTSHYGLNFVRHIPRAGYTLLNAGTVGDNYRIINGIHDDIDGEIAAITAKTVPVAADTFLMEDSAASDAKKSIVFSDIHALGGVGTPSDVEGRVGWDSANKALAYRPETGSGVLVQVGQEVHIRVVNDTGVQIDNGRAVRITGASGGYPTVALADATSKANATVVGLATQNIPNGSQGLVTRIGAINDIDTSSWVVGTELYLSETPGLLTDTPPSIAVDIAHVTIQDGSAGRVIVLDPDHIPEEPFGAMSMVSNATATVISAAGTWVKIAGTTTAGPLEVFTHADNQLTFTGIGSPRQRISASFSVIKAIGASAVGFQVAVFKNGSIVTGSNISAEVGSVETNVNLTFGVQTTPADYYEFFIRNMANTDDLLVTALQAVIS